jgi:AraC-like DNA-binding protein/ligand-binding sensor protein
MSHSQEVRGGIALAEQFEEDLRFFQLLLLLINKSCPIKNVDLVWTDTEPEVRAGLRRTTGTTQALAAPSYSSLLRCEHTNPNPRFCDVVSDHGRDLCCIRSDKAAETRVHQTGRTEVYRCHAGLIDIVVPVLCDGRHIASLYSGQVVTSPATHAGFVQIRNNVRGLGHVDWNELEAAYYEVPIVTEDDIRQTVGILEMFAEYLATAWRRLHDAVEARQRRLQQSQLDRKEMAHILLDGDVADRRRFRELSRAVGFERYPNRVLVVKPQAEDEYRASGGSFDMAFTRVLYAIEELCGKIDNVMSSYLRQRGICVFVGDPEGSSEARDVKAYALAQRLLHRIGEQGDLKVRIGIGRHKNDWQAVAESYQEALTALAESDGAVAPYKRPPAAVRALSSQMTLVCQALSERKLREAKAGARLVPILANRHLGEKPEELPAQRQFLISALESMMLTAQKLGATSEAHGAIRQQSSERLALAGSVLDLQECWADAADAIVDDLAHLYSGKHDKLIGRAQVIILRRLENSEGASAVSLDAVAAAIGVSAGHLSRTFKKITGTTFERYLMLKRVERARQLLLDPMSRVSEVAEKCAFCNPAYFARVFRKIAGCSPTEFSKNPMYIATDGVIQ